MTHRLLVLALLFLGALPVSAQEAPQERPQNVILMIPDGFGPASVTMARMAKGAPLALDGLLQGSVDTRATDSHVTDSAAGATAYAAGVKTYNGAISVDTLRQPVGTILQGAQARGMRTGLVTTTRLTHATPAAFAAHVPARSMEEEIAVQMTAQGVDLLLGGGLDFFAPRPTGRRTDDLDLVEQAREAGYAFVQTAGELEAVATLPLLGLFAASHMAYEVDRPRTEEPSLAEMTRKALDLLGDHPDGFFVMVEGGRIDHAGHGNDPVGHLHDILAYDEAVRAAVDFARADGRTLVVSVADHETGGLSIGRDGVYGYRPEVLLGATASAEGMMEELQRRAEEAGVERSLALVEEVLLQHAPLDELGEEEREALAAAVASTDQWEPGRTMSSIISARALVGWTTGGHTGVDVILHAYGPGSDRLRGVLANDEVGRILADLLQVDLAERTAHVRAALEVLALD